MTNLSDPRRTAPAAKKKKRRRTPAWIKTIGRNESLRRLASALTALYIRFVYFTGRWTIIGEEHAKRQWDSDEPFLMAFWHGRLLMMPTAWHTDMPMNVLISDHRDGTIISEALKALGIGSVRGSSSSRSEKGGARALRAMVRAIRAGQAVGISPDGPSGPRMRASEGICATAKLSGAPIIPATFAAKRRKVMNSWDRFVLPLPFSRCVFMWGEPITVDKRADANALELCRARVEQQLIDLTREADLLMGVTPVVPSEETAHS